MSLHHNTKNGSKSSLLKNRSSLSLSYDSNDSSSEKGIANTYTRNLTANYINDFLNKRPSTDVLIKNHLVQNTMIWRLESTTGKVPSCRNCHTADVVGNKMFLLGGYKSNKVESGTINFMVLDLEDMTWKAPLAAGSVPSERYSHTCTTIGTNLVLFGGFNSDDSWLNDIYVLDTALKNQFIPSFNPNSEESCLEEVTMLVWYQPKYKGTPPSPRAAATAVAFGKKIFYFGGNNGVKFFNDLHVFDCDRVEWKKLETTGSVPAPRAGHSATLVKNNKMVVFGGGVDDGYSNELFVLDLETLVWTSPQIIGTAPCPRAGHTAIQILNSSAVLVFGGGYLQKVFGDLHMYDVEMCTWTRPSDAGYLPQARAGHSCVSVSNIAYFFGGADSDGRVYNDVYSLDTAFLLLKNLSRSSKEGLKYIKNFGYCPTKNFGKLKEKYQNNLSSLSDQIEQLKIDSEKSSEHNIFLIKEVLKRQEKEKNDFLKKLTELKEEIKKSKSEISNEEIEYNDEKIDQISNNKLKEQNDKFSGVVKNVCNLFESIAIGNSVSPINGPSKKEKGFQKKSKKKNGKKNKLTLI